MLMTKSNRHASDVLPKEMHNILDAYPVNQGNNARRMVRGQLVRLLTWSKRQMRKSAWLGQAMWGLDLDLITGQDDGEKPDQRYDLDLSDQPVV